VGFPVKQHEQLSNIITARARARAHTHTHTHTQNAHTYIRKSEGCFRL